MNFNILHIIRDKNERIVLMVCIGIAFVVWLATKMSKEYEMDMAVKVAFEPPSENDILTKEPPQELDVRITGAGWDLMYQSLRRSIKLSYDLSQDTLQSLRQNEMERDIQDKLRKDIAIKNIVPDYVSLVLDAKIQKRVPVQVDRNISIAPQFSQTAPIIIQPDTILVIGPAKVLKNIQSWKTKPIELQNLSTRQTKEIPLNEHINSQVVFRPQKVTYDIIVEQLTERNIEIPIEVIGQEDSVSIYPNKIIAKCTMGLSHYERLKANQFRLVVDVSTLKGNSLPIQKKLEPQFLETVQYSADSVSFLVLKY